MSIACLLAGRLCFVVQQKSGNLPSAVFVVHLPQSHGLEAYCRFYNHERYHQNLDYAAPAAVRIAGKEHVLGAC